MTNRNTEVGQAIQSLEIIAQDVATSFHELVNLTDPAAPARPLDSVGVLVLDSDLRNAFGLVARINRLSNHLRWLQATVDRATRRAGRRLAKNRKSVAPDPGATLH